VGAGERSFSGTQTGRSLLATGARLLTYALATSATRRAGFNKQANLIRHDLDGMKRHAVCWRRSKSFATVFSRSRHWAILSKVARGASPFPVHSQGNRANKPSV
jgi:hypothetical protein